MALPVNFTFNVNKKTGKIGDVFTFSGYLTEDGLPYTGTMVTILKSVDYASQEVGWPLTDENGYYSFTWTASENGTFTFNAQTRIPAGIIGAPSITITVSEAPPPPSRSKILSILVAATVFIGIIGAAIHFTRKR